MVAKNIAIPQNKQFKGGDEIHDNSDLSLTSHKKIAISIDTKNIASPVMKIVTLYIKRLI